jgi:hypothetical protein
MQHNSAAPLPSFNRFAACISSTVIVVPQVDHHEPPGAVIEGDLGMLILPRRNTP